MRSYTEILDEKLHGTPVVEQPVAPLHVPAEREPIDILAILRNTKVRALLGSAAVLGALAAFSSTGNGGETVANGPSAPQTTATQGSELTPTTDASAGGDIFKVEPKHIDVSFTGINSNDGCVTNVVSFANQKIKTRPLMAYEREIEVVSLEVTTKTCIDENARFYKTEGQVDEKAGIVPLTVGLDATSIRTSTEITDAQLKLRTVLPGESLSATACKQIPVAGCPQNPKTPKGVDLDPTAEKALIATLEAVALRELQETCAAPIYKAAVQIPAQSFFDQLGEQQIPDSFLTFQIVDQNNKPYGNVLNYAAVPTAELKDSGAAVKISQQKLIYGNTQPKIEDCGVSNG